MFPQVCGNLPVLWTTDLLKCVVGNLLLCVVCLLTDVSAVCQWLCQRHRRDCDCWAGPCQTCRFRWRGPPRVLPLPGTPMHLPTTPCHSQPLPATPYNLLPRSLLRVTPCSSLLLTITPFSSVPLTITPCSSLLLSSTPCFLRHIISLSNSTSYSFYLVPIIYRICTIADLRSSLLSLYCLTTTSPLPHYCLVSVYSLFSSGAALNMTVSF